MVGASVVGAWVSVVDGSGSSLGAQAESSSKTASTRANLFFIGIPPFFLKCFVFLADSMIIRQRFRHSRMGMWGYISGFFDNLSISERKYYCNMNIEIKK